MDPHSAQQSQNGVQQGQYQPQPQPHYAAQPQYVPQPQYAPQPQYMVHPQAQFQPPYQPQPQYVPVQDNATLERIQRQLEQLGSQMARGQQHYQQGQGEPHYPNHQQGQNPQGTNSQAHAHTPPMAGAASGGDVERIRNALDQLAQRVQAVTEHTRALAQANPPFDPNLMQSQLQASISQNVARELNQGLAGVHAELDQLRREFASSLEGNRGQQSRMDDSISRIGSVLADMQNFSSLRPEAINAAVNVALKEVTTEIHYLRQGIDAMVAGQANAFAPAIRELDTKLDQQFRRLSDNLDAMYQSQREANGNNDVNGTLSEMTHSIVNMQEMLAGLPQSLQVSELDIRLKDLSDAMTSLLRREVREPDLQPIEERLDEITRALVAVSGNHDNQVGDNLDRIEARLASLGKNIETLNQKQANAAQPLFDPRFDELSPRLDALGPRIDRLAPLAHLPEQIRGSMQIFEERLLQKSQAVATDPALLAAINRLPQEINDSISSLEGRIASLTPENSPREIEVLERQIARLSDKIDHMITASHTTNDDEAMQASSADSAHLSSLSIDPLIYRMDEMASHLRNLSEREQSRDGFHGFDREASAKLQRLEDQISAISETIAANSPAGSFGRLEAQIETISRQLANNDVGSFGRLEAQIETISRQLANNDAGSLMAGSAETLSRLEDQVAAISNQLAYGPPSESMERLEDSIASIANRLNSQPIAVPNSLYQDNGSQILEQIQNLSSRVDAMARPGENVPATEQLLALEGQLAAITQQLTSVANLRLDLSPIENRLGSIEDQVAASRDIAIEVAREAVEQAINMAPPSTGVAPDLIAALQSDLRELQMNTRNFNDRNLETFDAVRDTLSVIVERLNSIEGQVAASFQAQQEQNRQDQRYNQASRQTAYHDAVMPEADIAASPIPEYQPQPAPVSGLREYVPQQVQHAASHATMQVERHDPMPNSSFFENERVQVNNAPGMDFDELPEMPEVPERNFSSFDGDLGGDSSDAPLEPGSGTPDLSALMRQIGGRKRRPEPNLAGSSPREAENTDVVAAARRAARNAEAENSGSSIRASAGASALSLGKVGGILKTRKAMLIGGGALVVLLALGIPMIGMMGGKSGAPVESAQTADKSDAPVKNAELLEESAAVNPAVGQGDSASVKAGEAAIDDADLPAEKPAIAANDAVDENLEEPVAAAANVAGDAIDAAKDAASDTADSATKLASDAVAAAGQVASDVAEQTKNAITSPVPEAEVGNAALRQAAAEGNGIALFEVGRRYTDGDGVKVSQKEAAKWYLEAANHDYAPAQYRLANMYEKGEGVTKDINKALEYYGKSADQGNVFAMHNMAALLAAQGKQGDMTKAIHWFEEAAKYGVKDSQYNLGIIYGKGMGVKADLVQSYKWFAVASKGGDRRASENRDVIGNQMRPEQVEKAKAEVEKWKPAEINRNANIVEVPSQWKSVSTGTMSERDIIRAVQTALNQMGFDAGTADGMMGAKTKKAIGQFQQKAGLPVDNKVSPALLNALKGAAS